MQFYENGVCSSDGCRIRRCTGRRLDAVAIRFVVCDDGIHRLENGDLRDHRGVCCNRRIRQVGDDVSQDAIPVGDDIGARARGGSRAVGSQARTAWRRALVVGFGIHGYRSTPKFDQAGSSREASVLAERPSFDGIEAAARAQRYSSWRLSEFLLEGTAEIGRSKPHSKTISVILMFVAVSRCAEHSRRRSRSQRPGEIRSIH